MSVEVQKQTENENFRHNLEESLKAIESELVLNVNVFIDGFECDVDPVVATKDEETARMLADFLYKQALASLTENVG